MLKFKGFIFDVDDTILDNKNGEPGQGLHERSRMLASNMVGEEMGIPELVNVTAQENLDAFVKAPIHSLDGAVWNLLQIKGLVPIGPIDLKNEMHSKIVRLKNEIHERILREEAEEIPGATQFIKDIANAGYADKLAVASSAIRRDIDLFFAKTGLDKYFPDEKIKAKEDFEHTKPHPEVYNMAFATLGLPESDKKNVIAFEDDPRGVMSAIASGLPVIAISTGRYSKDFLAGLDIAPTFVVESFEEARSIVGLDGSDNE